MSPAMEAQTMARTKKRATSQDPIRYEVTKIDGEILRQARVVVAFDGNQKGLAEFLSDILRQAVSREYDKRVGKKAE